MELKMAVRREAGRHEERAAGRGILLLPGKIIRDKTWPPD